MPAKAGTQRLPPRHEAPARKTAQGPRHWASAFTGMTTKSDSHDPHHRLRPQILRNPPLHAVGITRRVRTGGGRAGVPHTLAPAPRHRTAATCPTAPAPPEGRP